MASSIMFSALLGILLGEWRGTSCRTRTVLAFGLILLLISSIIAAISGYMGQQTAG
jgi:L-rhamnose-H+ transport protein